MAVDGGTKAVVTALFANAGIAITKFGAYLLTGASSLLAESIHSLADTSNQALLLIGGKRARREATPEHPFGYGRERYVYAFIVAIVLFSVGGLFALYEAYHKWQDPHPITGQWWWVPIVVLCVAIVFESYALRTAVIESNRVRGTKSWATFVRRAKSPELPVILLEDVAALVGLVLALVAVGLTLLTGNGLWDALGTALIGVLLVTVAIILAIEMKSLLLGESASAEHLHRLRSALDGGPDSAIDGVIHLRAMHIGPEELLVAAKLEITSHDQGHEIAADINAAEERARAALPDLELVMYLEPDLRRPGSERQPWQQPLPQSGPADTP